MCECVCLLVCGYEYIYGCASVVWHVMRGEVVVCHVHMEMKLVVNNHIYRHY